MRSRPARGSACSAADSLAGCSAWRRKASAFACSCSTLRPTAPPAASRTGISPRDYLDPPSLARAARAVRGRDDRVRERAGGGARIPGARVARDTRRGKRGDRARPHQREDVPRRQWLRRCAVRRAAQRRRRRGGRRSAAARHRQECALRLRRQGPGAREDARRRYRRVRRDAGTCRARADDRPRGGTVGDRGARRRRQRGVVAGRRESPSRRHPRRLDPAGAHRRAAGQRSARDRRRRSPRRSNIAACCASNCSSHPTTGSSSTRSRRDRTTAATTRSTRA